VDKPLKLPCQTEPWKQTMEVHSLMLFQNYPKGAEAVWNYVCNWQSWKYSPHFYKQWKKSCRLTTRCWNLHL